MLENDAHRRNYLYRIATNLVRDQRRRPAPPQVPLDEPGAPELAGDTRSAERLAQRHDLDAAMSTLRPRDRAMLWLAYAHGSTHDLRAARLGERRDEQNALGRERPPELGTDCRPDVTRQLERSASNDE